MASHFALFVDLENCGGKKSMLMDVIERVKIRALSASSATTGR